MKIKDRFNLSHVVGFFVGIVVTVIFNWVVFKDPKRITAPGVAALVAMSTFTLALWSAFKVEKWLKSKVNESGYKQSEKIIEELQLIILSIISINNSLHMLDPRYHNRVVIHKELFEKHKTKISNDSEQLSVQIARLNLLCHTIHQWNVSIDSSYDKKIESIIIEIANLVKTIRGLDLYADYTNTVRLYEYYDKIKMRIDSITISIDEITKNKYSDMFNYNNPTSPSKKVDQ